MLLICHLPKEKSGLLLHVGQARMFDVEIGKLTYLVGNFVDTLFDIVIHCCGLWVILVRKRTRFRFSYLTRKTEYNYDNWKKNINSLI